MRGFVGEPHAFVLVIAREVVVKYVELWRRAALDIKMMYCALHFGKAVGIEEVCTCWRKKSVFVMPTCRAIQHLLAFWSLNCFVGTRYVKALLQIISLL